MPRCHYAALRRRPRGKTPAQLPQALSAQYNTGMQQALLNSGAPTSLGLGQVGLQNLQQMTNLGMFERLVRPAESAAHAELNKPVVGSYIYVEPKEEHFAAWRNAAAGLTESLHKLYQRIGDAFRRVLGREADRA